MYSSTHNNGHRAQDELPLWAGGDALAEPEHRRKARELTAAHDAQLVGGNPAAWSLALSALCHGVLDLADAIRDAAPVKD